MDFEEQLEKAEKLLSPSLVGSSIRSADDSAHQNYIHPEKYTGRSKSRSKKRSILNSSLGASLDDLINEGALMESSENFDKFLDDQGNVKADAQYKRESLLEPSEENVLDEKKSEEEKPREEQETTPSASSASASAEPAEQLASKETSLAKKELPTEKSSELENSSSIVSDIQSGENAPLASIYGSENYSTPNLSEYQLDHQISDHSELLNSVKSYDPSKLPSSYDRERSKSNDPHTNSANAERLPRQAHETIAKQNRTFAADPPSQGAGDENTRVFETDSLHTPYLHRDERSPSRARSEFRGRRDRSNSRSRSRSRSSAQPHLARGDTYKNIHPETPLKYELPPDMQVDENEEEEEDEENERATRQTRPTMGESIAAAEANQNNKDLHEFHGESITRDPSLVTTGDYTNFNVDIPSKRLDDQLFNTRSQSSTNYLRSISRSKSRPARAQSRDSSVLNEKNDADPELLAEEGALISDDPYDQVTGLSTMVDKVLKTQDKDSPASEEDKTSQKKEILVSDKKSTSEAVDTDSKKEKVLSDNKLASEEDPSESKGKATSDQELASGEGKIASKEDETESKDKITDEEIGSESGKTESKEDEALPEEKIDSESGKTGSKEDEELSENKIAEVEETGSKDKAISDKESAFEKEKTRSKEEKVLSDGNLVSEENKTESKEENVLPDEKLTSEEHKEFSLENLAKVAPEETTEEQVNDVPAEEKEAEAEEQIVAEKAPTVTADDIKDASSEETEAKTRSSPPVVNDAEEEKQEEPEGRQDVSAEQKEKEASEQKIHEEAPAVSASDINTEAIASELAEKGDKETTAKEEVGSEDKESTKEAESVTEAPKTEPENEESSNKATLQVSNLIDQADEDNKTQKAEDMKAAKATTEPESKKTVSEKKPDDTETANAHEAGTVHAREIQAEEVLKSANMKEVQPEVTPKEEPAAKEPEGDQEEDEDYLNVSPEELRKHLEAQPIYIFTSLAGGMRIVQRTNRLATILQANDIKFEARDLGTDEEAKKIWKRHAEGKTLPGVVRGDDIIGNWQEIDEINEDYRLREVLFETL